MSLAANVHSGWPTTEDGIDADGETVFIVLPGPRNALRLDGFASVDFRISRRFAVRRGTLSLFLEISNVTDRKNLCCIDWDIIESPDGGPQLESSEDYWLPRLPAIGILWEF